LIDAYPTIEVVVIRPGSHQPNLQRNGIAIQYPYLNMALMEPQVVGSTDGCPQAPLRGDPS
jgi:hypothetical protein